MKRISLILLLFLGLAANSRAQEGACDCSALFDEVVQKTEANYIGLKHQGEERLQRYEDGKRDFSEKVKAATGVRCIALLNEFLDFFEDGHLSVIHRPGSDEAVRDRLKQSRQQPEELLELLNQQLAADSLDQHDRILGRYTDGSSDLIIIASEHKYLAYILSTTREGTEPGEMKAELEPYNKAYRGTYFTYGYAARYTEVDLYKEGSLLSIGGTLWAKTDFGSKRELAMVDYDNGINRPVIKQLDDKNVLISIPSFLVDYQVLKELIKKNEEVLLNAQNLIFDIRGNTGGNAIYFQLFPFFADQTMPGGQGHVLASADNQAYFERNLQYSKKIYGPVVENIKNHMGEIIDGPQYRSRTTRRKKDSQVKQVAILTDKGCMSAAESFILHAKGSSTIVTTFGAPTRGGIDYTSVNGVKLNCSEVNIYFGYPTSTLHKDIPENGYNKNGIIPDVPIDETVSDKIAYIMDYLKSN